MIKKLSLICCIFLFACTSNADFEDFEDFDFYDDSGLELDEYSQLADKDGGCFDEISSDQSDCNPVSVLSSIALVEGGLLSDALIGAIKLNPYLHTRPPQTRFITDQPLYIMWNNGKSFLSGSLFFNYMDKMFFSKTGNTINHYLALSEENTTRVIGDFGKVLKGLDLDKVVRLFENFKMREIKLGLMLQGRKQFAKGAYMGFQLPIYYFIRHYNATEQEKNGIQESGIFNFSGGGDEGSSDSSFIQEHFVGDTFGLGDMRFNLAYKFWEQDNFLLTIGTQLTVPISMGTRGLYGNNFNKMSEPEFIDLESFFCNYVTYSSPNTPSDIKAQKEAILNDQKKRFGSRILDWLSANLLVPPLGQEKQWSIGFFIEPQCHIQERISVKSRLTIDYLLGNSNTNRFLLVDRNLKDLNTAIFNTSDPSSPTFNIPKTEASNRLSYMTEAVQEKFGPNRVEGTVDGRVKVQFTIAPEFRFTDNWTLMLGYDYWYLQSENLCGFKHEYTNRFKLEDAGPGVFPRITTLVGQFPEKEELYKAQRPSSYQNKIFGVINYKRYTKNHDLTFTLGGDLTVGNMGIGNDFTIKAGLTLNF